MGRRWGKVLSFLSLRRILTTASQDTFVVGCRFSNKIIYPETFEENSDYYDPVYSTEYGVYKPNCGLDNVMLSWGHDEVMSIPYVNPSLSLTCGVDSTCIMCSNTKARYQSKLCT